MESTGCAMRHRRKIHSDPISRENSLAELTARHEGIEGRFKKLDATRFTAVIYQNGKNRAQCMISLGSAFGRGMAFGHDIDGRGNSYNEMVTVAEDNQHLSLKPSFSMSGNGRDQQLSY